MRNCSPPDERRPQGPQTHRQTLIMSSLSSVSGTKLSPHAQNCPFQPVLPEQGELCTARTTKKPSRENFVPRPVPNPVQNSPNTPPPAAQPVQNSPNTPKIAHFSLFCPSKENFVPPPPPRPPAGRTLYRSHHHDPQQGELCTAPAAQPIQNSPNTPTNAHFSLFCPSKENFVPPPPPRSRAGRTLYRTLRQTRYKTPPTHPHQQPNRYKTPPTRPRQQPNRYKTLPAPRSTAVPRKSSPSTPKSGVFRLFRACRANYFAHWG